MNKPLILFAALAVAVPALNTAPVHARENHRVVCENVRVRHRESHDNHRILGTGIGAVAGGLLGHQIGGGKGKTLATVGGAVAGGVIGNKVQKHNQDEHTYYTTERRCHDVYD